MDDIKNMESKNAESKNVVVVNNRSSSLKLWIVIVTFVILICLYLNGYRLAVRPHVDQTPKVVTLEEVNQDIDEYNQRRDKELSERRIDRLIDECVITESTIDEDGNEKTTITVTGELLDLIEEENTNYREKLEEENKAKDDSVNSTNDFINLQEDEKNDDVIVPSDELMDLIEQENVKAREKLQN